MPLQAVRNHSRGVSPICVLPESVADFPQLDRAACVVVCGAVRCRRGNRCIFCQCDTVATCFKIDGRQDTTKPRAWMEQETTKWKCTRHSTTQTTPHWTAQVFRDWCVTLRCLTLTRRCWVITIARHHGQRVYLEPWPRGVGSGLPMRLLAAVGQHGLGLQPGAEEEAAALRGGQRQDGDNPRQTTSGASELAHQWLESPSAKQ